MPNTKRSIKLLTFMTCLILFAIPRHAVAGLKSCADAKTGGACRKIVETGINVCEAKQSGKAITGKALKSAQEGKFGRSTNFGALVAKYRKVKNSAMSDAKNQKACVRAQKALRKDCDRRCPPKDDCDEGVEALNELAAFCKKNAEAAEAMAELAAKDAALFEQKQTGGDDNIKGSTAGGTTSGEPGTVTVPEGYDDVGGTGSTAGATAGIGDGSNNGGSNSGKNSAGEESDIGSGGATAGSTAGLGSEFGGRGGTHPDGLNSDDTNSGAYNAGGTGSGSNAGGSGDSKANAGKGETAPGYMIWGTPTHRRKKSTILMPSPTPIKQESKTVPAKTIDSDASKRDKTKIDIKTNGIRP